MRAISSTEAVVLLDAVKRLDSVYSQKQHPGCRRYTVFDKVAVNIVVEESQHGRRSLVLTLASRDQLPEAELVA